MLGMSPEEHRQETVKAKGVIGLPKGPETEVMEKFLYRLPMT